MGALIAAICIALLLGSPATAETLEELTVRSQAEQDPEVKRKLGVLIAARVTDSEVPAANLGAEPREPKAQKPRGRNFLRPVPGAALPQMTETERLVLLEHELELERMEAQRRYLEQQRQLQAQQMEQQRRTHNRAAFWGALASGVQQWNQNMRQEEEAQKQRLLQVFQPRQSFSCRSSNYGDTTYTNCQ